jgi:hypothetical protein
MSAKTIMDEETRSFQVLEGLMNMQLPIPTDADIERCIAGVEERLAEKAINRHRNFAVREGYQMSLEVLRNRITDPVKSTIGDLKTEQGRAIAMLAVDFLGGWCSEETLCGVPIEGGIAQKRKQQAG